MNKEKMVETILHVSAEFPVFSETFVTNEVRALRALGHSVVPLALGRHAGPCQPGDETLRDEAVHLASVPAPIALALAAARPDRLARAATFALAQRGIRPRSLLLAGARAAVVARRTGATHVHAHFALAAAATAIVTARLAGISCSFISHGYDIYGSPTDLLPKLIAADFALATCEDMRRDLLAIAPGARVRVVPCGIDPTKFLPAAPGAHRNGRILFVGRLKPQKGLSTLVEALATLPAAVRPGIDVVGDGELRASLEARAAALGLGDSIRFLGPRPSGWIRDEGPLYVGFVAPFVVAPGGERDTGPLVVKEALAMGLPVVASALMGLKETVTDECGRLVPPGDPTRLAEALVWLGGLDPKDRASMGDAGRRRVASMFTLEAQARGVVDAISELPGR